MSLPHGVSREQMKQFLIELSDLAWKHRIYLSATKIERLSKSESRNHYCWNGERICLNPLFPEDREWFDHDHYDWIEGRKFSGHDMKRSQRGRTPLAWREK